MTQLPLTRVGIAYAASLVVFLLFDIGWISFIVSPLYKQQLGAIVLDKPNLPSAVLFYLLYLAGLVFFAIAPALRAGSVLIALGSGAAYGFFAYITYALTNLAILRGWTNLVAASDVAWGVFVSAATAAASFYLTRWIGR